MRTLCRISLLYSISVVIILFTIVYAWNQTIYWAKVHYLWSVGDIPYQYSFQNLVKVRESEFPEQVGKSIRDTEQVHQQLLVWERNTNKKLFYEDTLMVLFLTLLIIMLINILLFTKVVIKNDSLKIYYPFQAIFSLLAKPTQISVSNIGRIIVNRTTPLGPDININVKIGWRDALILDNIVLPGYIFSNIDKVYKEIINLRPDLKVVFHKNSLQEKIYNP